MNKIIAFIASIFSNKAFAVGAPAGTVGLSAISAGLDPWPWVLATTGMIIMLLKTEPDTNKTKNQIRKETLANGIVSLVCGGLGGPWTALAVGVYISPKLESPLLMAFLISAFWQVVAFRIWPIAVDWLRSKVTK
jgi:hypothetical protein